MPTETKNSTAKASRKGSDSVAACWLSRDPLRIMVRIVPAISATPQVKWHVYPNAVHAFANHGRPNTYNAEATAQADARTLAFFRQWLDPARHAAILPDAASDSMPDLFA